MMSMKASKLFNAINEILRQENCNDCQIIFKEEYFKLIPHLSFYDDVEVRVLTDEIILEYESQLREQQLKLDSLEELVENIRNFKYE